MRIASYDVVLETPEALVIRDRGVGKTVTNDAEGVVARLLREGRVRPGMRLHYYDTDGRLDELKFDEKGFTGFSSDPPTLHVALLLPTKGLSLLVMLVPWTILFLGGVR